MAFRLLRVKTTRAWMGMVKAPALPPTTQTGEASYLYLSLTFRDSFLQGQLSPGVGICKDTGV